MIRGDYEQRIWRIMRAYGVDRGQAEAIAWLEDQDPAGDTFTIDEDGNVVQDPPGPDMRRK